MVQNTLTSTSHANVGPAGRRFSERELLTWALVGGSPAAIFAVRTLPHKTRKTKFKLGLAAVLLVQLGSGLLFLL